MVPAGSIDVAISINRFFELVVFDAQCFNDAARYDRTVGTRVEDGR